LFRKKINYSHFNNTQAEAISLAAYPSQMKACFEFLYHIGVKHFAIFGGAVRDTDYAAYHAKKIKVKDYDIRIWLPSDHYESHLQAFIDQLVLYTKADIKKVPCGGTNISYCFMYQETEFDISIRPIPQDYANKPVPLGAVAIDRANSSDIGLSSVAIDPSGQAWAKPEYLLDRCMKTLTVFPNSNLKQKLAYAARMKTKFPDHSVAWASNPDSVECHARLSLR
jgi:hypothetical protein